MAYRAKFESIGEARAAAARAFRSDLRPADTFGPAIRVGPPLPPPSPETLETARRHVRTIFDEILARETDGQRC